MCSNIPVGVSISVLVLDSWQRFSLLDGESILQWFIALVYDDLVIPYLDSGLRIQHSPYS